MIWLRAILAIAISALAITWIGTGVLQLTGHLPTQLPSAPGVSTSDLAALHKPYESLAARRADDFLSEVQEPDRAQALTQLPQLQAMVPQQAALSARLVRWSRFIGPGQETLSGIDEYAYADRIVRAETALVRSGPREGWHLSSFYVNALTNAQIAERSFTLNGKSPFFISLVLATGLVPVFAWLTSIAVLLRRGLAYRWLWLPAVILGVGALRLDGGTGAWSVQPLSVQLLGGSYFSADGGVFDPWIFAVSFPLGAILFWVFARSKPSEPV